MICVQKAYIFKRNIKIDINSFIQDNNYITKLRISLIIQPPQHMPIVAIVLSPQHSFTFVLYGYRSGAVPQQAKLEPPT